MLKRGDVVVVRDSKVNSVSDRLIKRRGTVEKVVCSEGRAIAAYVRFKRHKTETVVLCPVKSLEGISTINQMRTLNILKQTYL